MSVGFIGGRPCRLAKNHDANPLLVIQGKTCKPFLTPPMRRAICAGAWRRDGSLDAFEVLVYLPVRMLRHSENPAEKRQASIQKMADHLRRGGKVPPVFVIPLASGPNRGKYLISNGHHRVLAHKMAGRRGIWAWASVGSDCDLLQRLTNFPYALPESRVGRLKFPKPGVVLSGTRRARRA